MNERQEKAICERLARLCSHRGKDAICPMTRLSETCPDWDAPCPHGKNCSTITGEDWQKCANELSVRVLIESYGGAKND